MTQRHNIVNVLEKLNGTGFIGIDSITEVKALPGGKKNEYQGRVTKRTTGIQATVFENKYVNGYEQMVRRHLMESGLPADFKAGALPWGTKVPNTPIILHNGGAYLQVIVRHKGNVEYMIDGNVVKQSEVNGEDVLIDKDGTVLTLLPKKYSSVGQQGGLAEEDQVIVNTFKLESIVQLRAFGSVFDNLYYEEVPETKTFEVDYVAKMQIVAMSPQEVEDVLKKVSDFLGNQSIDHTVEYKINN